MNRPSGEFYAHKRLRRDLLRLAAAFFCLLAAGQGAHSQPVQPTPRQALLYWELNVNPDIVDPTKMSEVYNAGMKEMAVPVDATPPGPLAYYLVPRSGVGWLQTGDLPATLRTIEIVHHNGQEFVRFFVHPDDNFFRAQIEGVARAMGSDGVLHQLDRSFERTASRGVFMENSFLQLKGSTRKTYGRNPEKYFSKELADLHQLMQSLAHGKKFRHLTVVPEPLFVTLPDTSNSPGGFGIAFRDWEPVLSGSNYLMPMFTAVNENVGYWLSLINGYVNPNDFAIRHIAFPLGLAIGELGLKTGIILENPHFQNQLLALDENLRPLDHIHLRDVGDAHIQEEMAELLYSAETLRHIRTYPPKFLRKKDFEYRLVDNRRLFNSWTTEQASNQWYQAFGAGVSLFAGEGFAIVKGEYYADGYDVLARRPGRANTWTMPPTSDPMRVPPPELASLWEKIRKALKARIFGKTDDPVLIAQIFVEAQAHLRRLTAAKNGGEEVIAEALVALGYKNIDLLKARFQRSHSLHVKSAIVENLAASAGDPAIVHFLLDVVCIAQECTLDPIASKILKESPSSEWLSNEVIQRFIKGNLSSVSFGPRWVYDEFIKPLRNWSDEFQDQVWAFHATGKFWDSFEELKRQMSQYPKLKARLECGSQFK